MSKRALRILLLGTGLLAADVARAETIVFQEGTLLPNSVAYVGTQDTRIEESSATIAFGSALSVRSDLESFGGVTQGLVRFENLFGALPDRIPPGSTISSAVLTLEVFNSSNTPVGIVSVHRMTTLWNENSTWNSLVGGVGVGTDTVALADDAHSVESIASTSFDILPSLQAWASGERNAGWVFLNDSTDGVEFWSSEYETVVMRPKLTVTFTPPETTPSVPALSRNGLGVLLVGLTLVAVAATGGRFPRSGTR